jgi:acetyltransferase-like isoleucine patch superfamily enzyme
MISPSSRLTLLSRGRVEIKGKCLIEAGTLIKASSGSIILEGNIYINRNCTIVSHQKILIKKGVTIGPNVSIFDHDHNFLSLTPPSYNTSPIEIGENVWIGAGVIILKGVIIGENSVIGAGTIITKNIPNNSIVTTKNDLLIREIIRS